METLPQPPQPYTWPCQECGQPISFWDAGPCPSGDYSFVPVWCAHCWAQQYPVEEQAAVLHGRRDIERDVRRLVGLQGGTLISFRDEISNTNTGRETTVAFPGAGFAAVFESWEPSWPQPQYPWLDGRSRLVLLAAYTSAGRDIGAGTIFFWSYQFPDGEISWSWDPPEFVPTDAEWRRLSDTRGAFLKLRPRSGRPQGSGHFGTPEDLELAVFSTVCALIKKSRKPSYRPTYKEIGRAIGIDHRPARRDPLRDPARSFTRLCQRHGLNARELVDRAIVACANGE